MAKYGSAQVAFVLIDGVDVKGDTTEISDISVENVLEESTTLGDDWAEQTPVGMHKVTFDLNGFYTDDSTGLAARLVDEQDTQRVVSIGLSPTRTIAIQGAYAAKVMRKLDKGKLHKVSAKFTVSGKLSDGSSASVPSTLRTGDWTSTAQDNGAATTTGGTGYLQVTALSGFTGFVGSFEHSTDNLSWSTLLTFTNVTSAPASQQKSVTGTVNRYVRFKGDVTGAGSIRVAASFTRG